MGFAPLNPNAMTGTQLVYAHMLSEFAVSGRPGTCRVARVIIRLQIELFRIECMPIAR